MKIKEEIKKIYSSDGEVFYLYFDGTTHYDESNGKKIDAPTFFYLDKDFNILMGNRNKEYVRAHAVELSVKGYKVKIGAKCPLKETADGDFVPNTDENSLGIWRITTPEEKNKFRSLLLMQQADKLFNSKKVENKKSESKIPDFTKDMPDYLKNKSIYQKKYNAFRY